MTPIRLGELRVLVMVVMCPMLVVMVMTRRRTSHLVHVRHNKVLVVDIIEGVDEVTLALKLARFLAGYDWLKCVRDNEEFLARVALLHTAFLSLNHGASVLVWGPIAMLLGITSSS